MVSTKGFYIRGQHLTSRLRSFLWAATLLLSAAGTLPRQCPAAAPKITLAEELFTEGNFEACMQECSRVLAADKENDKALQLWTLSERRTSGPLPHMKDTALTGRPAQWLIIFYRTQIGPAIGQRCALLPSCSEYAMQALGKHGLLGMAMTGDRLTREPGIASDMPAPVRIGTRWFYTDTVAEHDWWMTPNPATETSKR